jgi:heme o synthase
LRTIGGRAAPGRDVIDSPRLVDRGWVARVRRTASAYVALTKPRIIELLLVTTVPAMVLARRGIPSIWLVLATLAGGTGMAGAANAINQYVDRDIDQVMRRTRRRPLPAHRIAPRRALAFALTLGVLSFAWLALTVNVVAAVLSLGALAFYVLVYTIWLKRRSAQNIVIGGAAGAAPVLVGWAAVTGRVGLPALVMFGIVFLWTPPHFWALALKYERDYAAAKVPMLPVVAGRDATTRQILVYAVILSLLTLVLVPAGRMGILYLVAALGLGALLVRTAMALRRRPSPARAMALFRFSIVYLALLFGAIALDALVHLSL